MKKQIVMMMALVLLVGMLATSSVAQMTGKIRGVVKDESGKPIVDAQVTLTTVDSGRKATYKTDKNGEYFSLGFQPGTYNIVVTKNGQTLAQINKVPLTKFGDENVFNIDLAKERAAQGAQMSEEDKKRMAAAVAEREKVKGLNQMLAQAQAAKDAGNCEQAVQIMQPAATPDQTKEQIWAALAEYQVCAKQYTPAIESYKKAISLAPQNGGYHNNLGQAYLKNNQIDEAIAEYNTSAQIDPTNAGMYYFNLGAVLTNKGKVDEAIAVFDKAIAADPAKADAYYWKGVNMLGKATVDKTGKMTAPPGTAEALNKYLELAPEGPNAQAAKDLLASIGASVQTSFGKGKTKK
ncbi:MAG TPA: tetratricopeptide repeat protein [Clostridia bacterium]|nr:tetratricopeptide repeat protein [Clostridia bacterium]